MPCWALSPPVRARAPSRPAVGLAVSFSLQGSGEAVGELLVPQRVGSRQDGSFTGQHVESGAPRKSLTSCAVAPKSISWVVVMLITVFHLQVVSQSAPAAAPRVVPAGDGDNTASPWQ